MILVFGGTTEGKKVAKILDELEYPYYYSTKTKVDYEGKGIPIDGVMTTSLLENFCKKHEITHIINASHPFAVQLHQMIADISIALPLIRFQRQFSPRILDQNVSYVDSFEEAIRYFNKNKYSSLLALSGVQTIAKLRSYWKNHLTWFRILDRDSSRAIADEAGFPKTKLLFGYPQSKTAEMELFTKLSPDIIFTKESGSNGKLEEKIAAAQALHIPIVILKKPKISNRYLCIDTKAALIEMITNE
ncbi:cobalt-precorrin-5B (C1)-methyltransferase/precorrin-6A/cobalt-precorrin-6A reductase [Aquimarina sp. EL_43]|uniref:precorrin-6A/cobalt-precorrin-6A reductase n=1 Tax=unclassified Aquimarina TaxID=2627091 RepID=UPI0018C91081|nr:MULTISPECIES: precorrin-6A/cobalt-precorrin-6A reductase [unclassified Aquimarina]MBG6130275.1 cobalt-precorrin-5B (C1)-methyltransferase/precorrin-6A/cobalt-precorrin-6A reductase [Aquimarina sp. EL_35]MBG6149055.1 cobalt-precorrin-5B (C1)-methyltransferase/precorrin-6A/cobalt-precorrin-6A reductase [Aquimarina sp. EL_32]MBG6168571.1 cobalt-precorrin-5B (C1)-methyltransferase/precorrin-6A/cobalt-precorrin-6A reductase [Aquimarina sp. EL_43]